MLLFIYLKINISEFILILLDFITNDHLETYFGYICGPGFLKFVCIILNLYVNLLITFQYSNLFYLYSCQQVHVTLTN